VSSLFGLETVDVSRSATTNAFLPVGPQPRLAAAPLGQCLPNQLHCALNTVVISQLSVNRLNAVKKHHLLDRSEDQILAIRQRSCGLSEAAQAAVLLPILIGVMIPFAMLAAEAISEPAVRERLTGAPVPVAGALVGMAIWVVMFGTPAWKGIQRLGWRRAITIANEAVTVTDKSLFGIHKWNLPLSSFAGVSHHVRTSLSGTRNELILVHKDHDRCLLIHMADEIDQYETETFAKRLGLPVLQPGILFRLQRNRLLIPVTPSCEPDTPRIY
jgi:hypothetical protein